MVVANKNIDIKELISRVDSKESLMRFIDEQIPNIYKHIIEIKQNQLILTALMLRNYQHIAYAKKERILGWILSEKPQIFGTSNTIMDIDDLLGGLSYHQFLNGIRNGMYFNDNY